MNLLLIRRTESERALVERPKAPGGALAVPPVLLLLGGGHAAAAAGVFAAQLLAACVRNVDTAVGTGSSMAGCTGNGTDEGMSSSVVEDMSSSVVKGMSSSVVEGMSSSVIEGMSSSVVEGKSRNGATSELDAAADGLSTNVEAPGMQAQCTEDINGDDLDRQASNTEDTGAEASLCPLLALSKFLSVEDEDNEYVALSSDTEGRAGSAWDALSSREESSACDGDGDGQLVGRGGSAAYVPPWMAGNSDEGSECTGRAGKRRGGGGNTFVNTGHGDARTMRQARAARAAGAMVAQNARVRAARPAPVRLWHRRAQNPPVFAPLGGEQLLSAGPPAHIAAAAGAVGDAGRCALIARDAAATAHDTMDALEVRAAATVGNGAAAQVGAEAGAAMESDGTVPSGRTPPEPAIKGNGAAPNGLAPSAPAMEGDGIAPSHPAPSASAAPLPAVRRPDASVHSSMGVALPALPGSPSRSGTSRAMLASRGGGGAHGHRDTFATCAHPVDAMDRSALEAALARAPWYVGGDMAALAALVQETGAVQQELAQAERRLAACRGKLATASRRTTAEERATAELNGPIATAASSVTKAAATLAEAAARADGISSIVGVAARRAAQSIEAGEALAALGAAVGAHEREVSNLEAELAREAARQSAWERGGEASGTAAACDGPAAGVDGSGGHGSAADPDGSSGAVHTPAQVHARATELAAVAARLAAQASALRVAHSGCCTTARTGISALLDAAGALAAAAASGGGGAIVRRRCDGVNGPSRPCAGLLAAAAAAAIQDVPIGPWSNSPWLSTSTAQRKGLLDAHCRLLALAPRVTACSGTARALTSDANALRADGAQRRATVAALASLRCGGLAHALATASAARAGLIDAAGELTHASPGTHERLDELLAHADVALEEAHSVGKRADALKAQLASGKASGSAARDALAQLTRDAGAAQVHAASLGQGLTALRRAALARQRAVHDTEARKRASAQTRVVYTAPLAYGQATRGKRSGTGLAPIGPALQRDLEHVLSKAMGRPVGALPKRELERALQRLKGTMPVRATTADAATHGDSPAGLPVHSTLPAIGSGNSSCGSGRAKGARPMPANPAAVDAGLCGEPSDFDLKMKQLRVAHIRASRPQTRGELRAWRPPEKDA